MPYVNIKYNQYQSYNNRQEVTMDTIRKIRFLLFTLIICSVVLSSCLRSASTPPADSDLIPIETQMFDLQNAGATQTALAGLISGDNNDLLYSAQELTALAKDGTIVPQNDVFVTATPTKEKVKKTAVPTTKVSVPSTYVLQKGEFPYCIARRFNIDINALLNANGLGQNQLFQAGMKITIPKNAPKFAGKRQLLSHPDTYIVQSGDTFYTIACKYGDVYPESIAEVNGLNIKKALDVGTKLKIP